MAELRAYMLQRAKVSAKIHAMETELPSHAPSSVAETTSPRQRLVLPKVDNTSQGNSTRNRIGLGKRVSHSNRSGSGSVEQRKQRPYSEPTLKQNLGPKKQHGKKEGASSHDKRSASSYSTAAPTGSAAPTGTGSRYTHSTPNTGSGRGSRYIQGSNAQEEEDRKLHEQQRRAAEKEREREMARQERTDQFAERSEKRMERRDRQQQSDAQSVVSVRTVNYGKVPSYIQKMKSDRVRAIQEAEEEAERIVPPPGFRQVEEEERLGSLENLKQQKQELEDEIHRRAPFRPSTMGQKANERRLNDNLQRVEEGLRLFSKEIVFVPEDCPPMSLLSARTHKAHGSHSPPGNEESKDNNDNTTNYLLSPSEGSPPTRASTSGGTPYNNNIHNTRAPYQRNNNQVDDNPPPPPHQQQRSPMGGRGPPIHHQQYNNILPHHESPLPRRPGRDGENDYNDNPPPRRRPGRDGNDNEYNYSTPYHEENNNTKANYHHYAEDHPPRRRTDERRQESRHEPYDDYESRHDAEDAVYGRQPPSPNRRRDMVLSEQASLGEPEEMVVRDDPSSAARGRGGGGDRNTERRHNVVDDVFLREPREERAALLGGGGPCRTPMELPWGTSVDVPSPTKRAGRQAGKDVPSCAAGCGISSSSSLCGHSGNRTMMDVNESSQPTNGLNHRIGSTIERHDDAAQNKAHTNAHRHESLYYGHSVEESTQKKSIPPAQYANAPSNNYFHQAVLCGESHSPNRGRRSHQEPKNPPPRKFQWELDLDEKEKKEGREEEEVDYLAEHRQQQQQQQQQRDHREDERSAHRVSYRHHGSPCCPIRQQGAGGDRWQKPDYGLDCRGRVVQPPGGTSTISLMWG